MELGIVLCYLFGTLIGGWIGYRCGRVNNVFVGKVRGKLQLMADEVDARLRDMDYENAKQLGVDLGRMDAVYELMNYMDNEMDKEE